MTTLYDLLKEHHAKYAYTKSRFKGDAPADSTSRRRTHFRIQKYEDIYYVRSYSDNIITAYSDGQVILRHSGWKNHTFFRTALKHFGFGMRAHNGNGLRQTALFIRGIGWIRWDNNVLQLEQSLEAPFNYQVQGPVPRLQKFKVDTVALKYTLAEPAVVEFRRVLPVLWAANNLHASSPTVRPKIHIPLMLHDPEKWPHLVASFFQDSPEATWQHIRKQLSNCCRTIIPA